MINGSANYLHYCKYSLPSPRAHQPSGINGDAGREPEERGESKMRLLGVCPPAHSLVLRGNTYAPPKVMRACGFPSFHSFLSATTALDPPWDLEKRPAPVGAGVGTRAGGRMLYSDAVLSDTGCDRQERVGYYRMDSMLTSTEPNPPGLMVVFGSIF